MKTYGKVYSAIVLVALAAFGTVAEAADGIDGNQLYDWVKDGEDSFKYSYAVAYIGGAIDAFNVAAEFDSPFFCLPDNVTRGQVTDVTARYLRENPDERHQGAAVMVAMAMVEAYPCE